MLKHTTYNVIARITTPSEQKYINIRCRSEVDVNNNVTKSLGTITDITELKRIENKLKEKNEKYELLNKTLQEKNNELCKAHDLAIANELRFKAITENAMTGIGLLNTDGQFTFINQELTKLFGYTEQEFFTLTIKNLLAGNHEPIVFQESLRNGFANTSDTKFRCKDNTIIFADISYKLIKLDNTQNVLCIIRDVTNKVITERELISAKEQAETSDKLKTSFLQNMSHEIRTPMNGILGFSELLKNQNLSQEKRNSYTEIVINSSKQLLAIVTNVLTISSLETKQEKINIETFSINSILDQIVSIFRVQASKNNVSLKTLKFLNDDLSYIYSDKSKLIQIITNLTSNALKFTKDGKIEIGYVLENYDDSTLTFFVKDTGIGIPEKARKIIFERFRQADDSICHNYGGTGLGLSICKGFAELLGGKIWVESVENEGSSFYFTIPFLSKNDIQFSSYNLNANNENCKCKIIVAEDEEFVFLYIEELLSILNLRILHAKNGLEAVELARNNPDVKLILMDIKMPVMDGFTAAKVIKEFNSSVQIVAQTAYALNNEVNEFKKHFDNYLTKPIKGNELLKIVNSILDIQQNK
ncbi:MAG: response regulator [Bacteroidales bacterium]|nr:response regulator [Bacteroidales bacterium]